MSDGVLIEERAKIDASSFSSLFADPVRAEKRPNTSKGEKQKHAGKTEDSLVFKIVRSNTVGNLVLEDEGIGDRENLKNVRSTQCNEVKEENFSAFSKPGTPTPSVVNGSGAIAAETASDIREEQHIDRTSQVGTPFRSGKIDSGKAMLNEASAACESAVCGAAAKHSQQTNNITGSHRPRRKDLSKHDDLVESKHAFEKVGDGYQVRSEMVQQRMNFSKLLERDKNVIEEGISWVSDFVVPGMKLALSDLFPSKRSEISPTPTERISSMPQPWYPGDCR